MNYFLRLFLTALAFLLMLAGATVMVFGLLYAIWTNPMTTGLKIMGAGLGVVALGALISILEYWLEARDDVRRRRLLQRARHVR